MLGDVLRPFAGVEFAVGLGIGLVALTAGALACVLWKERFGTTAPLGGLLLAAAGLLALAVLARLDGRLPIGLLLLAAAGLLAGLPGAGPWAAVASALPGSWLVTQAAFAVPRVERFNLDGTLAWAAPALVLTSLVGGFLVAHFDRRWRETGAGPVLVAISVAGVYATVPDTEEALTALGVALPVALLGWPWPVASLGGGAFAVTGLVGWTVVVGGAGRPSSIVGGLACLGLLCLEPLARAVARPGSWLRTAGARRSWLVPLAAIHFVLVAVASRVAGLRPTLGQAVLVVAAELVMLMPVLGLLLAVTTPAATAAGWDGPDAADPDPLGLRGPFDPDPLGLRDPAGTR